MAAECSAGENIEFIMAKIEPYANNELETDEKLDFGLEISRRFNARLMLGDKSYACFLDCKSCLGRAAIIGDRTDEGTFYTKEIVKPEECIEPHAIFVV